MSLVRILSVGLLVVLCATGLALSQEATVSISGVIANDGRGIPGVTVIVNETKAVTVTDEEGAFSFRGLAPGTYTLILTIGNHNTSHQAVVTAGRPTNVEIPVDWEVGTTEKVTVTAAAARAAKIVDAPAAITSITEEKIEKEAAHGQLPKVLEFTPGAEVTQSGLYDFNFNTRGFNSSLNRRVSTYVDGRDVGVVLLGAQEWAAFAGGLGDISSLEFIRGPSAALYGANASSGVINITTKAPRDSPGTQVRFTAGELETVNLDLRHAGAAGKNWFYKVSGGVKSSGDFSVSRNPSVQPTPEYSEYCLLIGETDCLPREKTLFREQDDDISFGSARFDRYYGDKVLTFEAGFSNIEGPVFQTGIGRVQIINAQRPFYRVQFATDRWNVLAHYSNREGNQANLTKDLIVNFELISDTERYGAEAQGNWNFSGDKGRLVVGAAYTRETVDTSNPDTGLQTVVYQPLETHREAIFSQFDWKANDTWKFVLAGRFDWNTLHDTQFSPKAAVVYSINPKHSIRATYNQAFQVANYSEFFLHARISSFPIGGFVRTICEGPLLPQPVDCGIDGNFVPILAVGNDDLELEKTKAWEIGYSGLVANKVFITADYYNAKNENFITDLLPQVGTSLGNTDGCVDSAGNPETDPKECPVNNDYLPWVSTDEAENTILFGTLTVAQALRNAVDNSVGGSTLGFRLAQDLDGSTVVVGRTYTNVGNVDTQGVDLGVQYFVNSAWNLQMSYSWFDFEILDETIQSEIEDILLPNTPAHKASLGASWVKGPWAASISGRWVQGFRWSAGVFQGDVPQPDAPGPRTSFTPESESYATGDLAASYRISKLLAVGINVANFTDNVHRQTFGGDLLSRRALANVTLSWD